MEKPNLGLREPPNAPGEEELCIGAYDDGTDYMLDAVVGQWTGLVIRRRDGATGDERLMRYQLIGVDEAAQRAPAEIEDVRE